MNTPSNKKEAIFRLLVLLALSAMAVTQPIYATLVNEGHFFIRREFTLVDNLVTILTFSIIFPAAVLVFFWLAGRLGRAIEAKVFYALVVLFSTLVVLPGFKEIYITAAPPLVSLLIQIAIAVVLGLGFVWLFYRSDPVRQFVVVLSLGVVFFPVTFLATYPYHKPFERTFKVPPVGNPTPVVVILMDELPLMSVLKSRYELDAEFMPNLASFARESTWYANAVTMDSYTVAAVPVMFTGNPPELGDIVQERQLCISPYEIRKKQPNNLFTLLPDSYERYVIEASTGLCPAELCNPDSFELSWPERVQTMITLSKRYISNILFRASTFNTFVDNFKRRHSVTAANRLFHQVDLDTMQRFIPMLGQGNGRESVHFVHLVMPHTIWEFYPSGQAYTNFPILEEEYNKCDEDPSGQFCKNKLFNRVLHQRHILQTGYTDVLLGKMFDQLRANDWYDKAMVVVLADHGFSFQPGEPPREISENNYAELMAIPMLIKYPGQKAAQVSKIDASTLDLLPTIADVLDINVPWEMQGTSLLSKNLPERDTQWACSPYTQYTFSTSDIRKATQAALETKLATFGYGHTMVQRLFDVGTLPGLMGRSRESLGVDQVSSGIKLTLDYPALDVFKGGHLETQPLHLLEDTNLAVLVNNRVVAVTQPFKPPVSPDIHFSVLVPEEAYTEETKTLGLAVFEGSKRPVYVPVVGQ